MENENNNNVPIVLSATRHINDSTVIFVQKNAEGTTRVEIIKNGQGVHDIILRKKTLEALQSLLTLVLESNN